MERKISPLEAVSIINEVFEAELIGDYSRAYQLLAVFWNDFRVNPDIRELPADIVAEVYLRCGSVAGYLGRSKYLTNAQEISRNLLTEAKDRFIQLARGSEDRRMRKSFGSQLRARRRCQKRPPISRSGVYEKSPDQSPVQTSLAYH